MTLVELLVSLACLSILVLYFSAFQEIASQDLFATDRRARVQNEAAVILESIVKEVQKTIGNSQMTISGNSYNPIYKKTTGNAMKLKFIWDSNENGAFDEGSDDIGCFKMREGGTYQVLYGSNDAGNFWGGNCAGGGELISDRLVAVSVNLPENHDGPFDLTTNVITISVTTCWNPTGVPIACGEPDNPQVTMDTSISMPMVSLR